MIMTVDIGGTKTLCAFWDGKELRSREKYKTSSIDDFPGLLAERAAKARAQGEPIEAVCLALAGPVTDDKLELTNTGQILDLGKIRDELCQVALNACFLNDLEALGYSLSALRKGQRQLFKEGTVQPGAKAVVSIGTGLGISAVTKEGIVLPSEGGHIEFAPQNSQQRKLLSEMETRYAHVSLERLLSGQGIANLYSFVTGRPAPAPSIVTERAFAGESQALETMDLFTQLLGAACGNYALLFLASGGVYLGGGIMPKILPLLKQELFREAFCAKGRFQSLLETIPVFVILDEMAPSLGAAIYGNGLPARG